MAQAEIAGCLELTETLGGILTAAEKPGREQEAAQSVPSSHGLAFKKVRHDSPLATLVNGLRKDPEIFRLRAFARLLGSFHLKNTVTSEVDGRHAVIDDRPVVNFGSANYLGFEQRPEIIEAGIAGLRKYGNHSGCSRLFSSHDNIVRLEEEVSRLVGSEKTLICGNVSQVHEGAIPALFSGRGSTIFIDKFAHTSMYEAAQIAKTRGARIQRVDIGDPDSLRKKLDRHPGGNKVLLIDGLYSMQGHIPDIVAIQRICDQAGTILYIDDAHGIGIFGHNGGGVAEELSLSFDNMILVGSLQKGLGCYGGFIAGNATMIDILRVKSKSYIFSGTLQPHAVEGALAAIELSRTDEARELRQDLRRKSRALRANLQDLGFEVPSGDSPIIPVTIGSDLDTLMAGRKLFDEGFYLNSVLYPAVPKGKGIIRISLNAPHSDRDIADLVIAFAHLRNLLRRRSGWRARLFWAGQVVKSKLQGEAYSGL